MGVVDDKAKDQSFEAWIAAINQTCGHFRADVDAGCFEGGFNAYADGALCATVVDAKATHLYRTAADACRAEGDKFFLVLQLRGACGMVQGGESIVLKPGDMTVFDATQACSVRFMETSGQLSMVLPRQTVERNLRSGRLRCGQRLEASAAIAGMARQLMQGMLQQSHEGWSLPESEAALDALVSLLKPAIGAAGESSAVQERLLSRALDFIDRHIDSDELGPEFIARSVGVSVRGLYRLFAMRGLVVAQYIRNRRLDFCADALRQPRFSQKLSSLSHAWGFSDSSHFSAAFKARFGVAPGEYRRRHAGASGVAMH